MKEKIIEFLESGEKCLKLEQILPIRDIENILVEQGFDELEMDGDETNGWQIDFWYKFNHPTKGKYTLSGSLHYGNFQLCKNE